MPSEDRTDARLQSICAWCGCSFRADKFAQWGTWQIADIRNVVAPARSVYGASGRCFEQTYTGRFLPVTSMRRLTNFPTSKRLCGMACYSQERAVERTLIKKGASVDYPHWRPAITPPGCRAYGAPIQTSAHSARYGSSRSPSPSRQSGGDGSTSPSAPVSRARTGASEGAPPPSRARTSMSRSMSMGPLGTVSESRAGTQGEGPKGAWLGLLSVVLLRGENLRLHYAGDLFASFDTEQTNPVCSITLNGRQAQRTGIIKKDTSPTFDEEFLYDLHERDARPEGLRVDVLWHDLRTAAETHIGYVAVDTHDLSGAGPRQIVGRLENDSPGAMCRGTLTVEVRLLEAQDLPNRDLYEPKEDLPPWWLSQAGSRPETSYTSRFTRTPLRASRSFLATPGGPLVSVSTVSVMPPSPREEVAREQRPPPQDEHRYMKDLEVKVRINGWDRTNTRKIVKVDRTGVLMGKLPCGGCKTVVPQEMRIQARCNKLARFFLERGQDRLAFDEVRRMRIKGYQVDKETDEALERCYVQNMRWTPDAASYGHKVDIFKFPTRSQTSPSKNTASGLGAVRSTTAAAGASRPRGARQELAQRTRSADGLSADHESLEISPSMSPVVKHNSGMGGAGVGGRWSDKLDAVYDGDM